MSTTRMRCGKCRRRKTFRADRAVENPPCGPNCSGVFKVDTYRQSKKEAKASACRCGAFSWSIDNAPHRKGSFSHELREYCVYAQPSSHSGESTH